MRVLAPPAALQARLVLQAQDLNYAKNPVQCASKRRPSQLQAQGAQKTSGRCSKLLKQLLEK